MHRGYIKIWRKIFDWEWVEDDELFKFFVMLVARANWKAKRWKGVMVPRGSFVAGRKGLARDYKKSEQRIRTLIKRLKSTKELTTNSTNRFTIYTIVNYDLYQPSEDEMTNISTSHLTNKQPASPQQTTTTKELKEGKKDNNNIIWVDSNYRLRGITEQHIEQWQETFYKVDVEEQLKRINLYCKNNHKWADDKLDWKRVIFNWLTRATEYAKQGNEFKDTQDFINQCKQSSLSLSYWKDKEK